MNDKEQVQQEPKHKKTYGIALRYKNALNDNAKWTIHSYTASAYSLSEAQATMRCPDVDYNCIDIQLLDCKEIN